MLQDEDGYFRSCPSLQGCYTQGETHEEVLANLRDAIRLHVEDRLEASCLVDWLTFIEAEAGELPSGRADTLHRWREPGAIARRIELLMPEQLLGAPDGATIVCGRI